MYLLFFFGAIVYGAITLLFLILSSSELLDSGECVWTSSRHPADRAAAFVASVALNRTRFAKH